MDALRNGDYETGVPPEASYWSPGDDPLNLCKIEMPQIANRAIWDLVAHPEIGRIAAEVNGAKMIQVWWVQLLVKPPLDLTEHVQTNDGGHVGWYQDRQYWGAWEDDSELFTAWGALTDVTAESGPV